MIYINLKTKCFHCLTLSYQFLNLPRWLALSLLPPSCSLIHHPATSSCFIKCPCCFKCELVSKNVIFSLPEDFCVSGYPLLFSSHAALCQYPVLKKSHSQPASLHSVAYIHPSASITLQLLAVFPRQTHSGHLVPADLLHLQYLHSSNSHLPPSLWVCISS